MDYSKEARDRQEKIQAMKDAGIICYANSFHGKQDISEIRKNESQCKDVQELMEQGSIGQFKTAGRIMSSRGMGKLIFGKIRDHSDDIQICFMRDKVIFNTGREGVEKIEIGGEEKTAFKIAEKFCQVGDYIGISGDLFLTKHNELTLFVNEFQVLSKAIRPLPEKFHGVTDQETIYRQRYLDLVMNNDSFERFQFRSNFVKAIREFYWKYDFLEIETPILGNSASGAAAQPFKTHHNDFDEEFVLRIAPETGLKKATVGRFERVFECGKNFRNEGSDPSHLQEFSVFEHYAAYWNFEDNMKFTEDMFDYIFETMNLDSEVKIRDKNGEEKMIDFTTPWKRIDYIAGVKEKSGIDIEKYGVDDQDALRADIKAAGHTWEGIDVQATATMIDYLYKKVLRPSIAGPAFVYNYPKTMQPLARQSDANENIVEQFQLVLNGWEVIKAYSELVDPKVQQENFDEQSGAIEAGDEEATAGDDDFVLAMEYGMPCQSGWGMGIDRMVSLLTEQDNLRDVVLFPTMKSEKKQEESKKEEK
ncbi:MAG: lysine--tRNA ligase [Candidatus Gracilibacteria bacterium]|nr:lysine--tRNA ligase [Candidatus Gracilibacteria bacterium]